MDRMTLWKANIDASRSRSEGRKIARGVSIKDPTVEEMVQAARNVDLSPQMEKKIYPHGTGGCITVDSSHPKIKTLKLIADGIRRIRKEKK